MRNQQGQIILILILVMTVALAIGISVVQRSLVDVSTSTEVEESSRAFSAAEAGIEKALSINSSVGQFDLGNSAEISEVIKIDKPQPGKALELESLYKEEVAQVWLADLNSPTNPPAQVYSGTTLDVYWGSPGATNRAALELTLVYYESNEYKTRKWYLDNISANRNPDNNFDISTSCSGPQGPPGGNRYQCYKRLGDGTCQTRSGTCSNNGPLQNNLMLLRARLLYNSDNQSIAVRPTSGSLPVQSSTFYSTGTSGNTQRMIKVQRVYKVVPSYLDYAIFSENEINK